MDKKLLLSNTEDLIEMIAGINELPQNSNLVGVVYNDFIKVLDKIKITLLADEHDLVNKLESLLGKFSNTVDAYNA